MTDETVFRLVCLFALVLAGPVRDWHWWARDYLRSESRRPLSEVIRESLLSNRESPSSTLPLGFAALLCFAGLIAYIANPRVMAWSAVEIPNAIRWTGAIFGWAGVLGAMWTNVHLGRQYSPLLRIKKGHALITSGPYAWVRHPLYSFGLLMLVGLAIAAANWFILMTGILAVGLAMAVRTPNEEAMLVEAFGDEYQEYMKRTGRFFPRPRV